MSPVSSQMEEGQTFNSRSNDFYVGEGLVVEREGAYIDKG